MAWNGSGASAASSTSKIPPKKPSALKGALAGFVIIFGIGVIVFFMLTGNDAKPKANTEKGAGLIKEVKPAVAAPTNVEPAKEVPYWERPTTNGLTKMQLMKWKHRHMPPAKYTNDTALVAQKYEIFRYESENRIAAYLSMVPGNTLVGTPRFDQRFKDDFLKSLEEPIIISETDSEEDKALKKLLRETKVDLKLRMDEGEDLCQIMTDTHKELQKMAAMKREFSQELKKLGRDENASAQDVEDYLSAANKLLEKKGVSPIKLTPLSKRMLLRHKGIVGGEKEHKSRKDM